MSAETLRPLAPEARADDLDDEEHDQIIQHVPLVGVDGRKDHEHGAQNGQNGHDSALEAAQILALQQRDVDGDIDGVQGDDGQLGGVELEGPEAFHDRAAVEVQQPQGADQQAEHGGVVGHVGVGVDILEHGQLGAVALGGQIEHTAGHGHGQAVAGAPAGDDDEHEDSRAAHLAEDVLERDLGAGLAAGHHDLGLHRTGKADVVDDVHDRHDDGADQQCAGHVLLGVLQLGADGRGADPALKGEGQGHDGAEQALGEGHLSDDVGEVELGHAVAQAHDGAHHSHEQQGDQLDNGGADGELTGQLGRQRVHRVGNDHEHAGQHHGAAAYHGVVPAHQHAEVAGGQPAQHGHQRGVVDDGHEPAHIVAVGLTAGGGSVAHQALHALVALCHDAKGAGADDHDDAHDNERQDTDRQIAAGLGQDGLRLEEHAGADDCAYHQSDGHRQGIPFFHTCFLSDFSPRFDCDGFHNCTPIIP